MCGIVGFVGNGNAKEKIIEGLRRLEYRGYDSAGMALFINDKIETRKCKGATKDLWEIIGDEDFNSNVGIGHTRWATHGEPSAINAHPHSNEDKTITVVHNGIIENYSEIKDDLIKDYGIKFKSETDTEVIAHLIGSYYEGDLHAAVNKAVSKMRGTYAIGAISANEPDRIVAVRKDSPLVAGVSEDGNFIASDMPALLKFTKDFYFIKNNETLVITKDDIKIFDENNKIVKRELSHQDLDDKAAEKDGYDHFMIKEIYEQPKTLKETLERRLNTDGTLNLDGISMTKKDIENFSKIYIVACGTAYHAGLVGKSIIEKMAKTPVEVDVASEFKYRDPYVDDKTLFICISQSGETLDTLEALREAKRKGARILSVVNVVGSSVARESDDVLYTWAGPEISVASTKAYTTQLMCMYIIGLYMGKEKGSIDGKYYAKLIQGLKEIPEKLEHLLEDVSPIEKIAKKFYDREAMIFIGRGADAAVAYEASLKLKEISYINSFAIAAGELKHGTIALIEKGTLVVAIATQDTLFEKLISNIKEVKARGAHVLGITKEGNKQIEAEANDHIYIPRVMDELTPLLSVVPLQLFAYYIAKNRGCDIDRPRNLAKSVTVE